MIRLPRLLGIAVRRQLLQWLAWRAFLLTLVINQAVTPLLGLAVWSAALPNSGRVSTYFVVLLAVQLMTVSYENHTFANGIYSGALSGDLLKPQPVVIAILGENLAMRCWHLLAGLPLVVVAGVIADVVIDPAWVLLAVPAVALAAALRFLFTYVLALSAFWTQQAHGVVGFGATLIFLLGGVAAPVPLLPDSLRPWVAALPFRSMLGFPAEIVTGSLDGAQITRGIAWQVAWVALFAAAAVAIWRAGVRRYTAVGG